jgi:hypothetical protein
MFAQDEMQRREIVSLDTRVTRFLRCVELVRARSQGLHVGQQGVEIFVREVLRVAHLTFRRA